MKSTITRRAALAAATLTGALALSPVAGANAADGGVYRIAGVDRYEASANIAHQSFLPGLDVAYVASGEVFTDALTGAPVAGMERAPVLLTKAESLPESVEAELMNLKPKKIIIFGGRASVSGAVANKLKKIATTGEVERIAGPTRYSTSAKISLENYEAGVNTTYIASGEVFPDALSGAPVAAKTNGPLLLVEHDAVPGVVKNELKRLQTQHIVILGGPATVSEEVESFLGKFTVGGTVTRQYGADRFDTSAAIAEANYAPGVETVYVASGRVFPDALSGAPVAGMKGSPVLLVDTDSIPASIDEQLKKLNPTNIVVLGGTATITKNVEDQLAAYLS